VITLQGAGLASVLGGPLFLAQGAQGMAALDRQHGPSPLQSAVVADRQAEAGRLADPRLRWFKHPGGGYFRHTVAAFGHGELLCGSAACFDRQRRQLQSARLPWEQRQHQGFAVRPAAEGARKHLEIRHEWGDVERVEAHPLRLHAEAQRLTQRRRVTVELRTQRGGIDPACGQQN
jgi:hypothetical protein